MLRKIAFLFLTKGNHNCEIAWNLFFRNIPVSEYRIYCHPKTLPTQDFLKNNTLSSRTPTRWGDVSLIRATLLLLKTAYQDKENHYFILVSDSCIPIVNFTTLQETLFQTGRSIMAWRHIQNRLDRYQKLPVNIRAKLSFNHFYSQHQWMVLRRDHVKLAIQHSLLDAFTAVHACDEHYFVSLFYLLGVLFKETDFLNRKVTYCDWSDVTAMHPKHFNSLDNQLIWKAHQKHCLFLRKVNPHSQLGKYLYFILSFNDKQDVSQT